MFGRLLALSQLLSPPRPSLLPLTHSDIQPLCNPVQIKPSLLNVLSAARVSVAIQQLHSALNIDKHGMRYVLFISWLLKDPLTTACPFS